ncbi:MAG: hypothetical protein OXR72_06695 [Gemmatimonadota bacterium]|nr:hypothetical protein [Gemmatimonadota bacterium]
MESNFDHDQNAVDAGPAMITQRQKKQQRVAALLFFIGANRLDEFHADNQCIVETGGNGSDPIGPISPWTLSVQGLFVTNNAFEPSSVTRVSCEDSYILPSRRADRVGPDCTFHLDTCGTHTLSHRRNCNQYKRPEANIDSTTT